MADLPVGPRDASRAREISGQEIKRDTEQKLHDLRSDYKRRETEIKSTGDAAINHIVKSTDDRIQQTRDQSRERLAREDAQVNKNYSELKTRSQRQIASLDGQVGEAEQRREHNVERALSAETATIQKSQEKLRDFLDRQEELRTREESKLSGELQSTRRRGGEDIRKTKIENNADLQNLNSHHKLDREELISQQRTNLDATRDSAKNRLAELRKQNDQIVDRERHETNESINAIHDEFASTKREVKTDNLRQLKQIQADDQAVLKQSRDRAQHLNEKMLTDYSKESQRIETEGEKSVKTRQEKFNQILSEQKRANADELKESETSLRAREEQDRGEHEAHLQNSAAKEKEALQNLSKNYRKLFDQTQKSNKETLDIQKEGYLKKLYKQSERFETQLKTDAGRSADPFYANKTFNAKLTEREDGYFVDAKVADYDRDTVEVKVQPDKISISGRRSYENTLNDGNERLQTNAYQTYRQDFKLEVPVAADKAVTTVAKDGTIRVFAPKKGHGTSKV